MKLPNSAVSIRANTKERIEGKFKETVIGQIIDFENSLTNAIVSELVVVNRRQVLSRLDYFINRMVSQRACLDFAMQETAKLNGPVFELGLGNGRTFDHMREIMPDRDIFVFERQVASNPASTPTPEQLILGDIRQTAKQALERFGQTASLIHADLGGHNLEKNDTFAREISPLLEPLLQVGGIFVSSDKMYFSNLITLPLPIDAVADRSFVYRRDK